MLPILADPILPVFAVLAIGYIGGRWGSVTESDARVVNRFAMSVLLPVFVFRAMAIAPWDGFTLRPILAYALAEATLYTAGYLIMRHVFRRPPAEALLVAFTGVFANNAYYGLPIAQFLYGEAAALPVTAVIVLDATLAFGGTMIVLEALAGRDAGASTGVVVRRIAALPIIWSLAAGIAYGLSGAPLFGPLDTFTRFVGQAASPVALFAMGVILSATTLRPTAPACLMTVGKVALFPATVWAMLTVLAPQTDRDLYLLASAGPTGAMAVSMALLYAVPTREIMQVTLFSSVLTLFTLAALA